ncbi:hypothetical protein BWD09_03895 [Neisseria dentiae]|uniref:Uncharacterized protein n=1 Tax=Neisseria dentiae TaxID=194197 RepID=A0A1X3DE63_9NEIS|nr:hypothetical protein [Neisseria dentiae]OSI18116.1 hypothetical protein BWD09_03895 [Neisseria dentiae]QMT45290.1 hypothetical protein H3L92_00015 [Neisseria dentiae]
MLKRILQKSQAEAFASRLGRLKHLIIVIPAQRICEANDETQTFSGLNWLLAKTADRDLYKKAVLIPNV